MPQCILHVKLVCPYKGSRPLTRFTTRGRKARPAPAPSQLFEVDRDPPHTMQHFNSSQFGASQNCSLLKNYEAARGWQESLCFYFAFGITKATTVSWLDGSCVSPRGCLYSRTASTLNARYSRTHLPHGENVISSEGGCNLVVPINLPLDATPSQAKILSLVSSNRP
jgi:hypothetical protein